MKKLLSGLTVVTSVLFIVVAIPVTVYILQNQKLNFQINAFLNNEPVSVNVVDIRGNSVKIAWITEKSVLSVVQLTGNSTNIFPEDVDTKFHMMEITNLEPATTYTYKIISDGVEFTKAEYTFTTATIGSVASPSYLVYGQVFNTDGVSLQTDGLVFVQLNDNGNLSEKIPAILNKAGGFQLNLTGLLNNSHTSLFVYQKSLEVSVEVLSGTDTTPITKTFTMDLSVNHQIPNIYLGDINIDEIPGVNGN